MKNTQLRMIKKIPQIILPKEKNEMFIDWYNKDLRFVDDIPKVFDKGYLILENTFFCDDDDNMKSNFSSIAKTYKTTYRTIENAFKDFIKLTKNTILYFEFYDHYLRLEVYLNNNKYNELLLDLNAIDPSKPNLTIQEKTIEMILNKKSFQEIYTYLCFIMLTSCLWYIATTTKTTKYYREEKAASYYYEKKEIINPKKKKYINTPIYDMNKIRKVKIEGLIKRRKGWTYSHAFKVHGHYRHYKSGKTIFIESFVKGKGKEEIEQTIVLNPK